MKAGKNRNEKILQMLGQGATQQEVGRHFGLTPETVGLIKKKAAAEMSRANRRVHLQRELRQVDDLDKVWPVMDLLDAFWLIVIARPRLISHFEQAKKTHLSLREFMDLAIAASIDPAGQEQIETPLLRVRGVGKYGFESVIAELTETDLGLRCNEEWRNRLSKLKRHFQIPSWPPNPRHRRRNEGIPGRCPGLKFGCAVTAAGA